MKSNKLKWSDHTSSSKAADYPNRLASRAPVMVVDSVQSGDHSETVRVHRTIKKAQKNSGLSEEEAIRLALST